MGGFPPRPAHLRPRPAHLPLAPPTSALAPATFALAPPPPTPDWCEANRAGQWVSPGTDKAERISTAISKEGADSILIDKEEGPPRARLFVIAMKDIDTLIRHYRPHLKDWIGYAPDRFIDELDRNGYITRNIYNKFKDATSTNKTQATNDVLNWLYDGGIETQVQMLKALQRVEDHYPRVKQWLKDVDARSLIARADEDALAAGRHIPSMPSPLSIRMSRGVVSETREFVDGAVTGQGEGNVRGHSGAIPKMPHQSFIDIHANRQGVGQSGQAGPMVGSWRVEKLATEIGNLQLRSEPWSGTAGKETEKFPVVQEDRSDSHRAPRVEEGQNDEDDFCSFVILHHEDDGDAARQVKNDLERFGPPRRIKDDP
ncbi:unnamed protein product [Lampetra planeri]